MKRSPLRRKTPLRAKGWGVGRSKPIKRKAPRRTTRQEREPGYLAWLHRQECVFYGTRGDNCGGRIEADHGSGKGMGQRRPDAKALPVCARHHRERPWYLTEPWLSMTKAERREFVDQRLVETRLRWCIYLAEQVAAEDSVIQF